MERHFARLWKLSQIPWWPDVMLPGESGVELLQFLRGNPATAEIPIIMATAKGMEYDKIQSLDLGADDYLVKAVRHDGDGVSNQGDPAAL